MFAEVDCTAVTSALRLVIKSFMPCSFSSFYSLCPLVLATFFSAALLLLLLLLSLSVQLSDLSFVAVFSSTMPYLHTISLSGCSHITDTALQLLTASCRRLSSITLSNCPQLTDKTLKRLSHCDHLATINIKSCRGVTAEGVAALATAPQVKAVAVTGCPGVRKSHLRACKQGSKVRVSESGRSSH